MKMEGSATVETVKSKILAMTSEKERLEREIALKNDDIEIERRKKEAAEAEVAAMTRRIRLLEEDFEQSSGRLTETSTKLDDASKAAEESESARWRLNNQQGADELKISELERAIATATMATEEAEWKYEETMKRVAIAQQTLATTQEQAETIEAQARELEEKLTTVASELKAKEIACEKNAELEAMYLKRLDLLREQLKEAESRAEAAEAVSKRYEQEIQRVKETLSSENKTFTLLRQEIDSALDEYHSI
uniref:Tropomyosin 1 low molecular weight isoform n=1 Tax=Mesocestoides corti TaxID=53468 RepID=E5KWJ3_MESCO|nr:tropomyosin 1 low molecular weight isoform [Mesocestoides corti]